MPGPIGRTGPGKTPKWNPGRYSLCVGKCFLTSEESDMRRPIELTSAAAEPGSMAARAYNALRDRLVLLEIAPTHPIHEPQLAEELGVGRTPMREALKRL